jgi:hypothetical protein
MTPFPPDPRPLKEFVDFVPSPLGGDVLFSPPLYHVRVGKGWVFWGHDYFADVYYTVDPVATITLTLPDNTKAFYVYASHGASGPHWIHATADDGTSLKQLCDGLHARGFGFYTDDPGGSLKALTVYIASPFIGLAVGEFGVAIPEPGALALLGAPAELAALVRASRHVPHARRDCRPRRRDVLRL